VSSARTPRERPALSRDRIVAAAVELADAEGIEGLSMRSLARSLGVEAMSLYHHVANKDDLLDGMVDAVFAEIATPAADGPWRSEVRARCVSLREVLLVHPWAVGRLDSRRTPGAASLGHHEAMIGCLRAGGFDVRTTALAFATLDAFVYGFALQELSLPLADDEPAADLAAEVLGDVLDTLPNMAELVAEHISLPGYRFAGEFEPGLDLILDGFERLRRPGPSR
jgi:AcrR family transcriptional regulator